MSLIKRLIKNLCNLTRTNCTTTFANSETKTYVDSNWVDKFNLDLHVVTRHYHFNSVWERNLTCTVHGTEIELWTIVILEWSVTTTFFLFQHVDRSLETFVRSDNSRVSNHHTTLHILLVDSTEEKTYVVTSHTFRKNLTEHLNTSNDRLSIFTKTKELNFVTYLHNTSLDTACSHCTTTCDREHILNRHQEWLINITNRLLNPSVASIHEFHHLVFPLWNTIQSTKSRTADDRSLRLEVILSEKILHIHLNELKHFFIVNHITLVHEHYKTWHIHLTSKEDVLTSLRHRTIGCSNHDDSTVHLSSTSNHVLHIVGVSRAVHVSVVTFCCLILDVSSVDSDTTLLLFWSIVNLVERLNFLRTEALLMKNLRNRSSKSSLTHECFFCHS